MRNIRQLIRDLSTIGPNILFRSPKGIEMILVPMNIARNTLETSISELVMKLVRHVDLQKGESDGATYRKFVGPKLRHAFRKEGGDTCSDADGINHIWKGFNKTRIQYCKNSVQLERICVSLRMFIWCKVNLRSGLIAGGKESKEG